MNDDEYCHFCGDYGDDAGIHWETKLSYVCDACCDGLVQDWVDNLNEINKPLPKKKHVWIEFEDWLKECQTERTIVLEWTDEEFKHWTKEAAMAGMTLEELVVKSVEVYLDSRRDELEK